MSALDATDCEQIIRAAAVIRSGQSRCTSSPAVYGRTGQPCPRCGDPIVETRSGDHARLLSWCPGCQQHRSPIASLEFDSDETREMDPHPAAVRFMSDLPWRRNRIAG
ncbi:MAG: zinc finger domain-containing protein [Ilumatobacteraceae bacterium]